MNRFRILCITLLCLLCGAPAAAQIQPLEIQPLDTSADPNQEPTIEDRIEQAAVVLLGQVVGLAPAEDIGFSDPQPSRRLWIATVSIEKVFKGAPGQDTATILFQRTENRTRPPLVDLDNGERAIFFLAPGAGHGHFEFVSPFFGKERATYDLEQQLEQLSESQGLAPDIRVSLSMESTAVRPGAPVIVRFRIENAGGAGVLFGAVPDPGMDLKITGPNGAPRQLTPADPVALRTPLYLPSGGFFGYTADISGVFDLTGPGAYSVTAQFAPAPAQDRATWSGSVRSKAVTFTVQ